MIKQTAAAKGVENVAYPHYAGEVVRNRFTFNLAALAALAVGDIIELGVIPSNCEVVDLILDADGLDSGGAIVGDVGVMSGEWGDQDDDRTCGAEFFSETDLLQAGGVARPTLASAFRVPRAERQRSIGLKITTAAGTPQAGNVSLTVLVAA